MLTRAGLTLLGAAGTLLLAGVGGGNPFYSTLALVPLGVLVAGLAIDAAHRISATVTLSKPEPRAGEEVVCEVAYRVDAGAGPVEFHVPLPDPFALVGGSNLHVVVKRRGVPLEGRFAFTFRATARGQHAIGPVAVEAVHAAGVRAPVTGEVAAAVPLHVRPREAGVRRIRGLRGYAKTLIPEQDVSRTGVRTTEFRELREYTFGDPIKFVNWKATARRASGLLAGTSAPLVNENEREGKQAVWLFLDAAPYMHVGSNAENAFDHAIAAALGVAEHYLHRGYRLGAYVYNHDRTGFLHPDVGRRQLLQLTRVLTPLKPGKDATEGLYGALDRAKGFLARDRPLVVVVTRLGKSDERTFQAFRRLRALTGRRRRRIPVLVVSLAVGSTIPSNPDYARDVSALLRRYERPAADRARRLGARVVEWEPGAQRLASLLLAQGRLAR